MSEPPEKNGEQDDLDYGVTLKGLRPGLALFGERYRLDRILGRGGMGVVWLARDEELGSEVALKFLPEFVASDKVALADLKEETRRSLELTHPNIVRTFTFQSENGLAAIVMEFVDGETLSGLRLDRPGRVFEPTDEDFRGWLGQLCAALEYAHEKGRIVHRDLKPSNLMIGRSGDLKITDFGIARSLNDNLSRVTHSRSAVAFSVGGTPPYMSPEQLAGEPPSPADDIYSLGATVYELLTGKPPFYTGQIYEQIRTRRPLSLAARRKELKVESDHSISEEWELAIAACLEKKSEDRPATVRELAGLLELDGFISKRRGRFSGARRKMDRRWLTGVSACVAIVLFGGGGAYWFWGNLAPRKERAESLVSAATEMIEAGAFEKASAYLDEAVRIYPALPSIESARADRQAALEAEVERAVALGDTALGKGDLLQAMESYEKALELDPDQPRASAGVEELRKTTSSIEVLTTPPSADVKLTGGQESISSPGTLNTVPIGRHRLSVSKQGYETEFRQVEIRNREPIPVRVDLVREAGSLSLESEPAGATFEVIQVVSGIGAADEFSGWSGTAPGVREEIPTGQYQVKWKYQDWPEFTEVIQVGNGKEALSKPVFDFSKLSIESDPAGQTASLIRPDGGVFSKGLTPLAISQIPTGPGYRILIEREGWPTHDSGEVEIGGKNGIGLVWNHRFSSGTAYLSVDPEGAEVTIRDRDDESMVRYQGEVPAEGIELPTGNFLVEAGYRNWPTRTEGLKISEGEPAKLAIRLPFGELKLNSEPSGASVYSEGEKLGETPLLLSPWPASETELQFRHRSALPETLSVVLGDREHLEKQVTMEPAELGRFLELAETRIDELTEGARWLAMAGPGSELNLFFFKADPAVLLAETKVKGYSRLYETALELGDAEMEKRLLGKQENAASKLQSVKLELAKSKESSSKSQEESIEMELTLLASRIQRDDLDGAREVIRGLDPGLQKITGWVKWLDSLLQPHSEAARQSSENTTFVPNQPEYREALDSIRDEIPKVTVAASSIPGVQYSNEYLSKDELELGLVLDILWRNLIFAELVAGDPEKAIPMLSLVNGADIHATAEWHIIEYLAREGRLDEAVTLVKKESFNAQRASGYIALLRGLKGEPWPFGPPPGEDEMPLVAPESSEEIRKLLQSAFEEAKQITVAKPIGMFSSSKSFIDPPTYLSDPAAEIREDMFNQIINACIHFGEIDLGLQHIEELSDKDFMGNRSSALSSFCTRLYKAGQESRAKELLGQIGQPKSRIYAEISLAEIDLEREKVQEARQRVDSIVAPDSDSRDVLNQSKVKFYLKLDEPDLAEKYMRQISADEREWATKDLARYYARKGNVEKSYAFRDELSNVEVRAELSCFVIGNLVLKGNLVEAEANVKKLLRKADQFSGYLTIVKALLHPEYFEEEILF